MSPSAETFGLGARSSQSERIQDGIAVAALVIAWLAMVLVANPRGHFPLNDDWLYARTVKTLLDTGMFALSGATLPNAIVHAGRLQPIAMNTR